MLPSGPGNSRAEFGSSRERLKKLTRVPTGGAWYTIFSPRFTLATSGPNPHGGKGVQTREAKIGPPKVVGKACQFREAKTGTPRISPYAQSVRRYHEVVCRERRYA